MSDDPETPLTAVRLEKRDAPVVVEERVGFLPIETNAFDRCFISVVIWVAISLFWFRFIEPMGLSIWFSNAISTAIAVFIVKKG
jgi:predicted small integral membrane protein|tara:strand:- start:534 stop:785 length:252 start_codon:yes stop_codon:yes gene_type:complete